MRRPALAAGSGTLMIKRFPPAAKWSSPPRTRSAIRLVNCKRNVDKGVRGKLAAAIALLLLLAGCRGGPPHAPAIGEAFVGPASLKIRGDIPVESAAVATVKHGDRLEILQRRRRFLRVRTPAGAEGWTDERQLLSAGDMASLQDLAARAARMPVQGQATSFGELNVHTEPDRQSPSFFQVKEKEKMDVLAHVRLPRIEIPRQPLLPPTPKKAKAARKASAAKQPKYPPPPLPKPPAPPGNWLDLSHTDLSREDPGDEPPPEPAKPPPTEDWSLIRSPGGPAGWVLTRRLVMGIPDDVAQYAEGRRIVSYFALGETEDGDQKKTTWLWTTIGSGDVPYDFDSFRVFVWSLRRHRYETAYIERNLEGYAPVLLENVALSTGSRSRGAPSSERYAGFSVCMAKSDGQRYRREYALLSNIVRFAGERPCEAVQPAWVPKPPATATPANALTGPAPSPPAEPAPGFAQRLRDAIQAIRRRFSSK